MKLRISGRARARIRRQDEWWRSHRSDAPELFKQELATALLASYERRKCVNSTARSRANLSDGRDDAYSGSSNGDPGWMGYGEPSSSQLSTAQYYGDGYPGCSYSWAPASCVSNTAFGQTSAGIGTSRQLPDPGDGNFYTYFKTNIDNSPGQSGGPFYRTDNILQGIVIVRGLRHLHEQ